MASKTITRTAAIIHTQIRHALYGRPGRSPTGRSNLEVARNLSKEFALASPMGGAAIIAIQSLEHHEAAVARML